MNLQMNVALSQDGVVVEAECECAVGEGPTAHCKHIQTLLFGINKFLDSGEIYTRLTCTQVYQQIHFRFLSMSNILRLDNTGQMTKTNICFTFLCLFFRNHKHSTSPVKPGLGPL